MNKLHSTQKHIIQTIKLSASPFVTLLLFDHVGVEMYFFYFDVCKSMSHIQNFLESIKAYIGFIVYIKTLDFVSLLAKYQNRNVLWKASVKLCLFCLSYCTLMIQPQHLITWSTL